MADSEDLHPPVVDPKALVNTTSRSQEITDLLPKLPTAKWMGDVYLYQWKGVWFFPAYLEAAIAFQSHFKACDDDVIVASSIKTGNTWLKALVSCIMDDKHQHDGDDDPLLSNHPHILIKTLEASIYKENPSPDLSLFPSPRLFATHLPYILLPESIKNSKCKMIYLARNPKDTLVSTWHFLNACRTKEQSHLPMEEAFESFCNGVHLFGCFFDHVLGYWKESLVNSEKILFLKYEELKRNPREEVKRLALFLGKPFGNDEEVDKVLWRCSIERLKSLEVNRNGAEPWTGMPYKAFFRLGIVGDWKNHFTTEMSEQIDKITRKKLAGSGLELET